MLFDVRALEAERGQEGAALLDVREALHLVVADARHGVGAPHTAQVATTYHWQCEQANPISTHESRGPPAPASN